MAGHNAVELLQPVLVGEDLLSQLAPVQLAGCVKRAGEGDTDLIPQGSAGLQHLMVQGVAVDDLAPQGADGPQGAGLARAGAAGEAQHHPLSASTTWKPAAFFSRLPMARPNPRLSGHWAKISVTSLVSKVRRASNTRWAWTSLSPTGPRVWTSCSRNRSANSSKQMTPEVGPTRRRISWADFSGAPVMTVTGALGA